MVRLSDGPKPEPIDLGPATNVQLTRSQSNPGQWHLTVELEKGVVLKGYGGSGHRVICTCKGFSNHKRCWHVAFMAGEEESDV